MKRDYFLFLGIIILLFSGLVASAPSSTSPAKIVSGFISNHGTSLMKWLWSLKTTSKKTAVSTKSMVKFENGYSVETVLDGSKLGIEPYSLQVLPNGELLILDSENSNVYKISSSLSLYCRPRLVTGSPEGYPGHVDGRLRDARLNNPKGLTVDDRGNIYVADSVNNAIRKISEAGVTTIAGGKMVRGGGGHVDGPSEAAKFSNDFDVVYVGSSCSLLVVDRGNRAIREIQLHFDDCAYEYGSDFPLGIAVLIAAGFFGYMLALLQRRLGSILSYHTDQEICKAVPDQKPLKPVRSSLIPTGDEQEESFLVPLRVFMSNARLFIAELFSGMYSGLKKKQTVSFSFNHQETNHSSAYSTAPWPIQESFVIHNKDEPPPPIETRNPTPKKTYPFMSKDAESIQQLRKSRSLFRSLDPEFQREQQHHRRHHSTIPRTHYEKISGKTSEIVFGPAQEQDQKRMNSHQNLHYRAHQSVSYPYGYYSYT
ncbi:BnaC05g19030D [Brassica napus]|uniref:BnaC05g19030D protein n=2 Tax=Brassica napus TaxID=3708 RepID=A0A078IC01_BRANA|nr:BnaC05g19030D [Brassica napus]